jgi:putative phage-type endonuclease
MNAPQRSEAWVSQRKGKLTCSYFGAALGLSPYMSRQALWRELTGRGVPFEGNVATDWGIANEPNAINAYEVETGELVIPSGFIRVDLGFPSGCSPDGLIGIDGAIEAKCPFNQTLYDAVPDKYLPQVLGTIHLTGRQWCDFISWTPQGHKIIRVERNDILWTRIKHALVEFWQCVEQDIEPARKAKFKIKE